MTPFGSPPPTQSWRSSRPHIGQWHEAKGFLVGVARRHPGHRAHGWRGLGGLGRRAHMAGRLRCRPPAGLSRLVPPLLDGAATWLGGPGHDRLLDCLRPLALLRLPHHEERVMAHGPVSMDAERMAHAQHTEPVYVIRGNRVYGLQRPVGELCIMSNREGESGAMTPTRSRTPKQDRP